MPERERVYFGAPTACGTTYCRAFAPIVIAGHDQSGGSLRAIIAAAGDVNGDGGDDLVVATPDNGRVYLYLARARATCRWRPVPVHASPGFGSSLAALFGTAPASP